MIIDFVKLHIAEALSEVANNYGNEEYLNEVVTINFDQLVEDIFNGINGYFTRDAWPSIKDVISACVAQLVAIRRTVDGKSLTEEPPPAVDGLGHWVMGDGSGSGLMR